MTTVADIIIILPVVVLAAWSMGLLLVDLWLPKTGPISPLRGGIVAFLAVVGMAVALGLNLAQMPYTGMVRALTAFGGMALVDGFAVYLNIIF